MNKTLKVNDFIQINTPLSVNNGEEFLDKIMKSYKDIFVTLKVFKVTKVTLDGVYIRPKFYKKEIFMTSDEIRNFNVSILPAKRQKLNLSYNITKSIYSYYTLTVYKNKGEDVNILFKIVLSYKPKKAAIHYEIQKELKKQFINNFFGEYTLKKF